MQKKTILFFLSLLLVLVDCTSCGTKPVDSSAIRPVRRETPGKEQPTQGSIYAVDPSQNDHANENQATNDPKEALTKILTELQELDELLNGSD